MSDFNLDMALAECRIVTTDELLASVPPCIEEEMAKQLADSLDDVSSGRPARRSPLADCLNRARSVPGRSDKVLAVRSAKLKLERAAEEERAAVRELLADVSASELLAILAPSAVRLIVSALTGTK